MVNLFRPKTMRRMAVFMALVAPIVYLFGTSFSALTGAHGEEVLASYHDEYVMTTDYEEGKTYKFVFASSFSVFSSSWSNDFVSNGLVFDGILSYGSSEVLRYHNIGGSSWAVFENGTWVDDAYKTIEFVSSSSSFPYMSVGVLYSLESVKDDSADYSNTLFGSFFPRDNFLVQWGRNAISEEPYGFAPFGAFWRYLDTNVLHLSHEQIGLMGYGYMYYAAHVLLFDVGFILVTFFLSFIQKVGDKFGGEER